jgi:hypothetical protein
MQLGFVGTTLSLGREFSAAIRADAVEVTIAETYHQELLSRNCASRFLSDLGIVLKFEFMTADGNAAGPRIPYDSPGAEATPSSQELSRIADMCVPHFNGNRISAHFDAHVARVVDARGLKAKILISRVAILPQHALNRFHPLRRFTMRDHQNAVKRE